MATLYDVLGCSRQATCEQILAEYRAKVTAVHPDKFPDEEKSEAQEKFRELQNAKEILCNPTKRRHYDAYLALGTSMSLNEWMQNQEKLQQTLHWASSNTSPQMIEHPAQPTSINVNHTEKWTRHHSPTISAFRNYEI
uniref:J domain-containing protein n=1 Tax=Panagrolaimus sp. JU765 TaxID=591449 RepID=A0AC34PV26_9BILA